MKTNGKKFKLFIGDEEIAEGVVSDCDLDLTDAVHDMESTQWGSKMSFSSDCSIDTSTFEGLYRAMMMKEIKELTDNYNRVIRIKNKSHD